MRDRPFEDADAVAPGDPGDTQGRFGIRENLALLLMAMRLQHRGADREAERD